MRAAETEVTAIKRMLAAAFAVFASACLASGAEAADLLSLYLISPTQLCRSGTASRFR